MASTISLSSSLPAGALICRGWLRANSLRGHSQSRWLGTKYVAKLIKSEQAWNTQAAEISAGTRKNLFDELDERGFIKDVLGSKDFIRETMRVKRIGAYAGVDPTGPSLHLGHVLAFMPLFWMYLHGYGSYTLIGGSTAKIGDPTGRTESRPKLASAELVQNLTTIHHQLKGLWQNVEQRGIRFGYQSDWAWRRGIPNNNAWWNKRSMLEVMKRLGNLVRMGPMLGRDNVKTRLAEGSGMSFAEFCYPLMQGWDWYELLRQLGIQMQIGGSDQFGNILTGAECVKHCVKSEPDESMRLPIDGHNQPIGFTVPLLTDASGAKFGKSAGNALWLDPFRTSPFDLYGYLVRRSDDEVERLLKLFTFHPLDKIASVMEEHRQDPPKRVAQHLLAHEILWLVHGKVLADQTQLQHRSRYGRPDGPLDAAMPPTDTPMAQANEQYRNAPAPNEPIHATNRPRIDMKLPYAIIKESLARITYAAGLATSVTDADRSIKAGGIYLGGSPGGNIKYQRGMISEQLQFVPIKTWEPKENLKFLIDGKILLIRKGKHNVRCIELVSDEEWKNLGLEYPGQRYVGAFRKAVLRMESGAVGGQLQGKSKVKLAKDKVDKQMGETSRKRLEERARWTGGDKGLVKEDDSW